MILRKGLDAAVITSSKPAPESVIERIHTLPTLVSNHPVYIAMPLLGQIQKIISAEKPDIIHIQGLSLLSLVVLRMARRLGVPVVAGIHDLPKNIAVYSPIARNFVSTIAKMLLVHLYNGASVVVAPSKYAKLYYRYLGVQTDIRVISNGVDLTFFYPSCQSSRVFEKQYLSNIDLTLPRVMFVGRIMPDKDLEVMIKATRDLEVVPIIIGYAWPKYLRKLKALACGKATFTGPIPSYLLAGAYNSCKVFIQPSTTELQSLVVLEALASGLPVIGANSGAIPELIIEGINGYLFEPYRPDELKRKIQHIFENEVLIKDMKAASLKTAERHSLTNAADDYIKLYTEYVK
jgi:1,2-diacylglycerol 3-alpha-glucosyltransferase